MEAPPSSSGPAPEIDFGGIVTVEMGDPASALTVTSPDDPCGEPEEQVEIEAVVPSLEVERAWFAPDWSHLALPTEEGIAVLKLNRRNKAYEKVYTLSPSGGYSDAAATFTDPRFSPDGGKLWFEKRTEDKIRLVSVEHGSYQEGGEIDESGPEFDVPEMPGDPGNETLWAFTPEGEPQFGELAQADGAADDGLSSEHRTTEDGQVAYASVKAADGENLNEYVLLDGMPAAEDELWMRGVGSLAAPKTSTPYGAIAKASIKGDGSISLSEVVPLGGDGKMPNVAVADADGKQVLFQTSSGVYTTGLGGEEEPEKVAEEPCLEPELGPYKTLAWS
ncbi:hypothetical protein [Nocardiopsis composta]|uniref:Uncharacterized protein n=1 Tax=Nocardiopsis composta TaxID=157465 RepID=A0A7W8QL94_9ACTN|nr:hypothetical protein [Nocardiopsis composta]MBB5432365.1 hypothetical protein [Nocardiopsis composta]